MNVMTASQAPASRRRCLLTMAEEVLVVFVIALIFCGGILGAFESFGGGARRHQNLRHHGLELTVEQVQSHEHKERVKQVDVESLQKRLSSVEEEVQPLTASRNDPSNVENVLESIPPPKDANNEPFCVPWDTNMDTWWTHHPDWLVSSENATHQCFSPMEDEKAEFFRQLYDIQFNGDCSKANTEPIWSNGWASDFQDVMGSLKYSYENGVPSKVQHVLKRRVAQSKGDAPKPVCESNDMSCYFLPLTSCKAGGKQEFDDVFMNEGSQMDGGIGRWLFEYATRPQTWLRHEVYKLVANKIQIETPCAVMHVHRTNIVLHGEFSRKYRQIQEYIDALPDDSTKNILLISDDQNAVDEARTLHEEYNWIYIDKLRRKGVADGWGDKVPADPKLEVIEMLATLRLVRQCSSFIHTNNNFAFLLKAEMQYARQGKDHLRIVNLDDHAKVDVFGAKDSLAFGEPIDYHA